LLCKRIEELGEVRLGDLLGNPKFPANFVDDLGVGLALL
jgi:hypothetical protein